MKEVYGAAFKWAFGWDEEISPEKYLKGIYNGIKIEPKNVSTKSFATPAEDQTKTEDKKTPVSGQ
jgi:hypothetical protein